MAANGKTRIGGIRERIWEIRNTSEPPKTQPGLQEPCNPGSETTVEKQPAVRNQTSDNALIQHSVGDFEEAGDVGAVNVVTL
jgi:hypothetical protein